MGVAFMAFGEISLNSLFFLLIMRDGAMSDGVLSVSWRSRLLKRLGASVLLCVRCGCEITVGSRIHLSYGCLSAGRSQWISGHKIPRVYHAACYEAMFID